MAQREFNEKVSASGIRNWISAKDKDFSGRTWTEEWANRIASGTIKGVQDTSVSGQLFETEKSKELQEVTTKTPMQRLTELKQNAVVRDSALCTFGDEVFTYLIADIKKRIQAETTFGNKLLSDETINLIRKVMPFHAAAKSRMLVALKDVKDLEEKADPEELYGKHAILKDPQAMEHVRNSFFEMLKVVFYKDKEDEESQEGEAKNNE
jgi:hypothetical protein